MQEPDVSLALIDKVMVTDPYLADLRVARMDRLLRLGRGDEAAAEFNAIRRIAPTSALVKHLCGERTDCTVQFVARQN